MDREWNGKFQVLILQGGEMKLWEYLTKAINIWNVSEYPHTQKIHVNFESSAIISHVPLQLRLVSFLL